ncbi:MAG: hypothetical protein HYS60_01210, partial [Candidatus Wildermuthbacteria bacterium]|nr:hypothetical protein [Candidatus Wildermuthbacteria bacterium]
SEPALERAMNGQVVSHLGKAFHIDEFVRLEGLPRTLNGKVDKIRLQTMYAQKKYDHKD